MSHLRYKSSRSPFVRSNSSINGRKPEVEPLDDGTDAGWLSYKKDRRATYSIVNFGHCYCTTAREPTTLTGIPHLTPQFPTPHPAANPDSPRRLHASSRVCGRRRPCEVKWWSAGL
ncbi:hypothetical protein GALMADRAFT_1203346 [Galerina marginata CBS 339.88]|uniref:Uncharacterized protein n=1 Tax=Galerina marginata (strain CBS 339.88) TaxID=685588 RepID=A0A067S5S9_GALM3|nr:hypothetical protein GALMADRAFT_1203346 [Galerina marginata CBS 339.88]